MELSWLRRVYGQPGPFATIYLERRSPGEDAEEQVRLRWDALRDDLGDSGAPTDVLKSLDASLFSAKTGEVQAEGRVLVAADAGVLLDAPWDAALGTGDHAHWSDAPVLGAFVREEARSVRLLVAIVNQQGAVIRQEVVSEQHPTNDVEASTVEGGSIAGVHKPREGALAHSRIQRRADEAVKRNAKDVVDRLKDITATFDPQLLVLAGEVNGRTAIRHELTDDLAGICTEIGRGGTDDDGAESALADEIRRVAGEQSADHSAARTEQFHRARAHDLAVEGSHAVARAAAMGAVETMLLVHETPAPDEASLLRECALGDADVDLLENGTRLTDAVGAILRFPIGPNTNGGAD